MGRKGLLLYSDWPISFSHTFSAAKKYRNLIRKRREIGELLDCSGLQAWQLMHWANWWTVVAAIFLFPRACQLFRVFFFFEDGFSLLFLWIFRRRNLRQRREWEQSREIWNLITQIRKQERESVFKIYFMGYLH